MTFTRYLAAAVLLILTAAPAAAQPYVFAGLAWAQGDVAPAIGAGWSFGKYFALEAAYADLGEETSHQQQSTGAPGNAIVTETNHDTKGARISAVGSLPILEGQVRLLGLLSAYRVKRDEQISQTTFAPPAAPVTTSVSSSSTSRTEAGVGLGAQILIAHGFHARAIVEHVAGENAFAFAILKSF